MNVKGREILENQIEELLILKKYLKKYEDVVEEKKKIIKNTLSVLNLTEYRPDDNRFELKMNSYISESLDSKRLKKENPDIWNEYRKESNVTRLNVKWM